MPDSLLLTGGKTRSSPVPAPPIPVQFEPVVQSLLVEELPLQFSVVACAYGIDTARIAANSIAIEQPNTRNVDARRVTPPV